MIIILFESIKVWSEMNSTALLICTYYQISEKKTIQSTHIQKL